MTTRIPVTIEGNLTGDPQHETAESGNEYARFTIAVNDRRRNETSGEWEDAGTVYHRVVAFDGQSRNVADSLRRGDSVIVSGELRFGTYIEKETGSVRETRDVLARTVGASLKFTGVEIDRAPKASGPAAESTGPVATSVLTTDVGVAR
jgi:single-strand DNA-binding protein